MKLSPILLVILSLFGMQEAFAKDFMKKNLIEIKDPPAIGQSKTGEKIYLGGFSSLQFLSSENGEDLFLTNTDRGPNLEPIKDPADPSRDARPFLLPEYEPRLVWLSVNRSQNSARVNRVLVLKGPNGKKLTGLPNKSTDEKPIDAIGKELALDPNGIDPEGVVLAKDGSFWLGEEYGPSLVHFDKDGNWLDRYLPGKGLPEVLKYRKNNRGFEGLTSHKNKLFAFLQSPLITPNGDKKSRWVRILEFDLRQKKTSAQYLYELTCKDCDKIGDAHALPNGELLVIERDGKSGRNSHKKIFRVNIEKASNLENFPALSAGDGKLESMSAKELEKAGITIAKKTEELDLVKAGFDYSEKAEGIAVMPSKEIVIINDNDFGVIEGANKKSFLLYLDKL